EDGIRDFHVTGVQTCALPILPLAGCSPDDSANTPAPKAEGPPEVGVVTLKSQRITFTTELPGRTVAPVIAQIRPQVNGIIKKQQIGRASCRERVERVGVGWSR